MKTKWSKVLFSFVLIAPLLAGPGCVHEPVAQETWSEISPNSPSAEKPVTADQVNPANVRTQILPALRAELASDH